MMPIEKLLHVASKNWEISFKHRKEISSHLSPSNSELCSRVEITERGISRGQGT